MEQTSPRFRVLAPVAYENAAHAEPPEPAAVVRIQTRRGVLEIRHLAAGTYELEQEHPALIGAIGKQRSRREDIHEKILAPDLQS